MAPPRLGPRLIALAPGELRLDPGRPPGRRERALALVPWATVELLRHGGDLPMSPDVRYEAGALHVVDGAACVATAVEAGWPGPIECVIAGGDALPEALERRTYPLPRGPAAPAPREAVQVLCFAGPVPAPRRQDLERRLRALADDLRRRGGVRFSDVIDARWPAPAVLVWRAPYVDNPDDPAGLPELHRLLAEQAREAPALVAWNGRRLLGAA